MHAKEESNFERPADIKIPPWLTGQQRERPPQDDSHGKGDGGSDSDGARRRFSATRGLRGNGNDASPAKKHQKKLGINGLMQAFSSKTQFSGGWDEDLDNTIAVFETLSTMCQLTEDERIMAIPVILAGDALSYYSNHVKHVESFGGAMKALREWFNSDEKKTRTLTKWQTMTLSEAFENDPESSEALVFRHFDAKLTSLQKQLDTPYHTDTFLRDRLLTAVDIPPIQSTLRDRMPTTSQQAVNRVANQLSDKPRTAGTNPSVNYSLGNTYHGEAKRKHRKPWMNDRSKDGDRGGGTGGKGTYRLSPRWMQGVKGCFVCGQDHRANTKHPPEEVTAAINRLKARHPQALLTVEDLAAVIEMTAVNEDPPDKEQDEEPVWLDEDDSDSDDDYDANVVMDETEALANLTNSTAMDLEKCMANVATAHGLCYTKEMDIALAAARRFFPTGRVAEFEGITIDTGANRRSVICRAQLRAYERDFGRKIPIRPSSRTNMRGIGGKGVIMGEAELPIPFDRLDMVLDIAFVVLERDFPTLLSNKDMIDNCLDISIQDSYLSLGNKKQSLKLENYFLKYHWDPRCLAYVTFTEQELLKMHRSFGHPSVRATYKLLRRADESKLTADTMKILERIAAECSKCRRNEARPRRFRLTAGTGELRFNHIVVIHTMFIDSKPVLPLVDESTHFMAACFLKSQSARDIWKAIMRLWILVYMGPPDHLAIDQGSNYIIKEFRDNAAAAGISIMEAPIENPGTIGVVERYHAPLRRAYNTIREKFARKDANNDECLHMAVYANNVTIGPEGLCPMLLVFGALPRPVRSSTSASQLERQRAIEAAAKAVQAEQAKRRVSFALRHPSSKRNRDNTNALYNLPAGSPVLLYRTTTKKWEGPQKFISIDGETAIVQLPHGRRIFRSHCVKPFVNTVESAGDDVQGKQEMGDQEEKREPDPDQDDPRDNASANAAHADNEDGPDSAGSVVNQDDSASATDEGKGGGDDDTQDLPRQSKEASPAVTEELKPEDLGTVPRKINVKKGSPEERAFAESRQKELRGLLNNGTFVPVPRSEVPDGHRIFGSRFVDELKRMGDALIKKSRLIAQNYADDGATSIPSSAPTVQRFIQRVLVSIAASFPELRPFVRDITKAYVQANTLVQRLVFILAPAVLGLPYGYVLKVVKPLYGFPESGLHWYLTYLNHQVNELGMTRSRADACVMYRRSNGALDGIVVLQVDDSLGVASNGFLDDEGRASKAFKCKDRAIIGESPTTFNGVTIRRDGDAYTMTQTEKIEKLRQTKVEKEYASMRAMSQYVGVNTRPDVCESVQLLVPQQEGVTKEQTKKLGKVFDHLANTKEQGLIYVNLDMESARIALVTDASFANAPGDKSQLGCLVMLMDKHDRCKILHYGSNRCHRVCRSVMVAEMHAQLLGFDYAYVVQDMLGELLGRKIEVEVMTDSRTLFNVVKKDAMTTERRLQIDIMQVRQSYDIGEIRRMGWLPGAVNPEDPLSKYIVSTTSPLYALMRTYRFAARVKGYAESQESGEVGVSMATASDE